MSSRPLSDRAPTGAGGGGHAVPVVRAEHHQEVRRRLPPGRTVAEQARREPRVDSRVNSAVNSAVEGDAGDAVEHAVEDAAEPATDRFTAVVVPRQREEPPTERVPVVPPAPAPSDGLLVVLPELERERIPDPAPPRTEQPSRSAPLVVPGQRGPQRSPRRGRTRRPLLIAGASLAAALVGLTAVTGVVSAMTSSDPTPAPAVVVSTVADTPQSPAQTPPR